MPQRKQTGIVLIAFVVTALLVTMSALYFMVGWQRNNGEISIEAATAILLEAKEKIRLHALYETNMLGAIAHYPDVPVNGNLYDGMAENACIDNTWWPLNTWVTTARDPNIKLNFSTSDRCFGRFPWKSHALISGTGQAIDSLGITPWVHYSSNLTIPSNCLTHRTPLLLGTNTNFRSPGCPLAFPNLPLPWLTIRDAFGNLKTTTGAFILILPSIPFATSQSTRSTLAGPDTYIDAFSVVNCPIASCATGGPYNNASAFRTLSNTVNSTYYLPPARSDLHPSELASFAAPYEVNDRFMYQSYEDFTAQFEPYVFARLSRALMLYKNATGHYPYAAPLNGNVNNAAMNEQIGLHFGWVPLNQLRTIVAPLDSVLMTDIEDRIDRAGWLNYIFYAVASTCTASATGCAGNLQVGSRTGVQALLIAPGRPLGNITTIIGSTGNFSTTLSDYLEAPNTSGLNFASEQARKTATYNDRVKIIE